MKIDKAASIPLITQDPYCSIWSPADRLYDRDPEHWSGIRQKIRGYLTVNGQRLCFLGDCGFHRTIPQTGLDVTPVSTEYTFALDDIRLYVKFTSPLLLEDRTLVSRPCSYVDFVLEAPEGTCARVELEVSDDLVSRDGRPTVGGVFRSPAGENRPEFSYGFFGAAHQQPLGQSGDHVTADWGYVYLASQAPEDAFFYDEPDRQLRARLELSGGSAHLVFAWDDLLSVNYMGQWRSGYWTSVYDGILDAIGAAIADRVQTLERAAALDRRILEAATAWGGEDYAFLCCMSYRQSIAAHKLVTDEQGNLLFLSKENDSNGCIGTVDVSYPSVPLFLLFDPEYVKGMLRPVFAFAASPVWTFDFAPHDVGRYPYAWGQVYAYRDYNRYAAEGNVFPPFFRYPPDCGIYDHRMQMPVEECGNMLLMTAAVCIAEGSADFARPHMDTLETWAGYLRTYGADPGEQLCTDDFAGHLNHNTNLSVKAILGIEAWGRILELADRREQAQACHALAREMAGDWEKRALAGDHYGLTFDRKDGWSLKYNLVWDRLLGCNLFSPEVFRRELACYRGKAREYGIPLDSRKNYTKSDWILWCASLAENPDEIRDFVAPLRHYLTESTSRAPFSDWYDTVTGCSCAFRGRSVQGGIFMPLLMTAGLDTAAKHRKI